jgi:drug/metabolite transporter (DMT)-like permease
MKWILVGIVIGATVMSDALQVWGVRRHGEIHDFRPSALGRAFAALARNWYVVASVSLLAVSFFSFLTLLSMADLSFAVPATALSYALETVVAWRLLKERVTWRRWTGAGLVACGVALLSL